MKQVRTLEMKFNAFHLFIYLNLSLWTLLPGTGSAETLVAFGDSLTEGCGTPGSYMWSCGWEYKYPTYPAELEFFFQGSGWENRSIAVKNFGKGGETTAEGVNRIDTVLSDPCVPQIEYVLLLQGTNDLFFHESPATVRFNLGVMIDKIRAKGARPAIATLTPDPDHPWKDITLLNDEIRSLAAEKGALLIDLYTALADDWYWYTNPPGCYQDQLHPNPEGFRAIASVWYDSLAYLLKPPLNLSWLPLLLGNP